MVDYNIDQELFKSNITQEINDLITNTIVTDYTNQFISINTTINGTLTTIEGSISDIKTEFDTNIIANVTQLQQSIDSQIQNTNNVIVGLRSDINTDALTIVNTKINDVVTTLESTGNIQLTYDFDQFNAGEFHILLYYNFKL